MIGVTLLIAFVVGLFVVMFVFFTKADRAVLLSRSYEYNHKGTNRTYRLYAPNTISSRTKLIIGLHGFGGSSRRFAYYTALHNVAPDAVIIYPDAIEAKGNNEKTGWNADFCCGSGWVGEVDDVDFLISLAKDTAREYGVFENNLYATGFSNGAFMVHRLATEQPEAFNSYAAVSGTIGTNKKQLTPTKPVSIMMSHGKKDNIVNFEGGVGTSDPDFSWLPFAETKNTWQKVNGTSISTLIDVYPEDGHKWHDWRLLRIWNKTPKGSQNVVDFFDRKQ